jgi:hypothetical protein
MQPLIKHIRLPGMCLFELLGVLLDFVFTQVEVSTTRGENREFIMAMRNC